MLQKIEQNDHIRWICFYIKLLTIYNEDISLNPSISSATQTCPALCDSMDCSTPGFPVHHQLPALLKFMSIESVMSSNHLILCRPLLLLLSILPSIRVLSFTSVGLSTGVSASASVLPMNIQDIFPLGFTGLNCLQFKELKSLLQHHSSKAKILWRSAFFILQRSHPHLSMGKTIALTSWTFVSKVMSAF